ncbi:MAG: hypothetical protein A2745_02260 [Candidatus Harrisonbacteria bacterium RIFCSPHIGHO2_01_FULL_44_13]|uniref:Uncharacterized protein n=1 Tax=Candidatus Harrisonbacteria bacterium RIFCSPLOWO2_01_FULL_44_18 TaxID=1798407 RepID=A0A1G1ZQT2_9BACT|nr:MAG: hypothetical protein A2745_02260 [Candidatus Harrisonbacteria bacterium RIFCSPHIGHO2_01_FULL_44_13]OGY66157.1 MAG: hypothetical protein A3A16_02525 [Candidatus Harrisonbacteria bacterium RIFCSPLOWO2_01_FULL_44_18]
MILEIINFLNTNAAGLTLVITLVAGVYKFWQFVNIKKEEGRQRDFENYHNLIERNQTAGHLSMFKLPRYTN